MPILQYKAKHFGKRLHLYPELEPDSISHEFKIVTLGEETWGDTWQASAKYMRRRDGNHDKKFVLLEVKRKHIAGPYRTFDKDYILVLTHDPFSEEKIPRPMQFWVDSKWIEPLKKETYESDDKKRLLKNLRKKWDKNSEV